MRFPSAAAAESSFWASERAVHGIHAVEKVRGAAGFIALQMADQVPRGIEAGERRVLRLEFLHAIFAEVAQASFMGRADCFRGECFRDGDEGDFVGAAAGALRRPRDLFAHTAEIRKKGSGWHDFSRDFNRIVKNVGNGSV